MLKLDFVKFLKSENNEILKQKDKRENQCQDRRKLQKQFTKIFKRRHQ